MDEDQEERIKEIVNEIDRDVQLPPYDVNDSGTYSREYQEYKQEEELQRKETRYERICERSASLLTINADESTQDRLSKPLRLLQWNITPGMVVAAAILIGLGGFIIWGALAAINTIVGFIPTSVMLLGAAVPLAAGVYTYYYPVYAAKNKVIESSGEMILAILYMVVYMRSSPNLEGAVRFAALNLEGPVAKDLRGVLWRLEVGEYSRIEESLEDYTRRWKDYNDDFLESLQLLQSAMNQGSSERRQRMLQDAIDRILEGSKEEMKHYAQGLKTPVMILNAMGAMLPVLGMIMLPLVSVFLGDAISELHLFMLFNVLLPGFLYLLMQKVLSSRPPTVTSKPVSEDLLPERGRYHIAGFGIPTWPIGGMIFLLIGLYGFIGYAIAPYFFPVTGELDLSTVPAIFVSGDTLAPLPMLMRSLSIVVGLGWGIGFTKILGNIERKHAEEHLKKIEGQFPAALFQLGNKISGGTPIEVALGNAAEETKDLEISELFSTAARNIQEMGMTFEESIFDETYGALQQYPTQTIKTVMKAVLESSKKGTSMASMTLMTISRYLENIHNTQEELNDLLDDTTTTIQLLGYMLAPVVSGVAVGMSQTIITTMTRLSASFQETTSSLPSQSTGGTGPGFSGIIGNLDSAIAPEVLQFVVGLYLIQLLYILGNFYMKIVEGENPTYKNMFTGKIMVSGLFFYGLTLVIVGAIFGGLVSGAT